MKKVGINYRSKLGTVLVEGERIELKIDRMTQNRLYMQMEYYKSIA